MSQKVVLIKADGGQVWIDNAPDGDHLRLDVSTRFSYKENIHDARWGDVRMFTATSHNETLEPDDCRKCRAAIAKAEGK